MSRARYLVGDVFDRMADLPDGSVDLVLTSPPFLALRSYLPPDHPDKAKEIGTEPDPAAFLDTLLHLTAEWRRVLAPHGSIAVELGDTYSGSGGAGGDYAEGGLRDGQPAFSGSSARKAYGGGENRVGTDRWEGGFTGRRGHGAGGGPGWPLPKSLCGIPHLYHLSLAYGRNLLTGEPSPAGQWRVRNVIAWCRPNPPVGALGDKFRPATSYMTIATIARDRYFDLDAVRTPHQNGRDHAPVQRTTNHGGNKDSRNDHGEAFRNAGNPAGAPPLDWWEIPTQPYSGSHYATWPEALLTRPIAAMCPQRVCTECGEPSRRIAETTNAIGEAVGRRAWRDGDTDGIGAGHVGVITRSSSSAPTAERQTLGWTDCGHDSWRNGLVLDPFAGSGTTLAVATGHGRDCIGIDLDERNADLARERVGMFLDVEYPETAAQP